MYYSSKIIVIHMSSFHYVTYQAGYMCMELNVWLSTWNPRHILHKLHIDWAPDEP